MTFKSVILSSFFKLKKPVSMLLVLVLVISLAGCGNDLTKPVAEQPDKKPDPTISTEELSTEDFVNPVDEPNQEIDPGVNLTEADTEEVTEATTEASSDNNGEHKYTIYDGLEVSLPFDIEEYTMQLDNGAVGIKIAKIAEDYGWTKVNEDSSKEFVYDCGDYQIKFSGVNHYNDIFDFHGCDQYQMESFHYGFVLPNSNDSYYGSSEISGSENTSVTIYFNERPEKSAYMYLGTTMNMSKDDAILIAYFLSIVKNNPGKNPLANISGAKNHLTEQFGGRNGLSIYLF